MKETNSLTFEIKKLQMTDDDIVGGEIHLKSKEFEVCVWNEESNCYDYDRKVKITNCVKQVGIFKKNESGLYEIEFNEKGFFTEERLLKSLEINDSIYSIKDINHFVKQLIVMHKMAKKMNKYQKKGWVNYFLCCAKNEKDEDIIFNFASKRDSTKESKTEFYNSKLKEHNLKHNRVFFFIDVEQLDYFNKLIVAL